MRIALTSPYIEDNSPGITLTKAACDLLFQLVGRSILVSLIVIVLVSLPLDILDIKLNIFFLAPPNIVLLSLFSAMSLNTLSGSANKDLIS